MKLTARFLTAFVLLISCLMTALAQPEFKSLSSALEENVDTKLLLSDLDFIIEKVNAKEENRDPFLYCDKAKFYDEVNSIKTELNSKDSLSRNYFFAKAGPLLTMLMDDHSALRINSKWMEKVTEGKLTKEKIAAPLAVLIYNKECYVAASDTIPLKSKIISLNDIPVIEVIEKCLEHVKFSEYYAVENNLVTAFDFPKYAPELLALFGFKDNLNVKYIPYGDEEIKEAKIELHRFFEKDMMKSMKVMNMKRAKNPSIQFNGSNAVLTLPSLLIGKNQAEDLKKWLSFFENTFAQIDSVKPENLVIDISFNGGGSEYVGYILLNYLYDKKLKDSYTPLEFFNSEIIPLIGDSLKDNFSFKLYEGNIFLLVSEFTFSSAARLADLFKTYSIGKVIGRETKGFRTHYGEMKSYTLPGTELSFTISSKLLFSASGETGPGGIKPDYEIQISNAEDLFDIFENNLLLNKTIEYISGKL